MAAVGGMWPKGSTGQGHGSRNGRLKQQVVSTRQVHTRPMVRRIPFVNTPARAAPRTRTPRGRFGVSVPEGREIVSCLGAR